MQLSQAASVQPSRIRAIAALADLHPGTLRLYVGEDTLPTPDFIKAAAHRGHRRQPDLLHAQRGLP